MEELLEKFYSLSEEAERIKKLETTNNGIKEAYYMIKYNIGGGIILSGLLYLFYGTTNPDAEALLFSVIATSFLFLFALNLASEFAMFRHLFKKKNILEKTSAEITSEKMSLFKKLSKEKLIDYLKQSVEEEKYSWIKKYLKEELKKRISKEKSKIKELEEIQKDIELYQKEPDKELTIKIKTMKYDLLIQSD